MRNAAPFFAALCILFFPFSYRVEAEAPDGIITEDLDFEELFDDIRPVDLKQVNAAEIEGLPSFTPENASRVAAFLDSAGTNPEDAANIPGLTTLERTVIDHLVSENEPERGSIQGMFRTGTISRPGNSDAGGRYYSKLTARFTDVAEISLIGDHDPREPRTFDAVSGSLALRFDRDRTQLVIGDYRPSFGQRLVFSRYNLNYTAGADAIAPDTDAVMNRSFEESLFLRGLYGSARRGMFSISGWASRRALDATLDEQGKAVAIRTDGIHDSGDKRGNLTEMLNALEVTLGGTAHWRLSILGATAGYDPVLAAAGGERTLGDPAGSRFTWFSTAGEIAAGEARLFFEHAAEGFHEQATIAGIQMGQSRFRGVIAARDYSPGYWAFRSSGISSLGGTGNERGVYAGIEADIGGRSTITASFDLAKTRSRTYMVPMPRSRRRVNLLLRTPFGKELWGNISVRSSDDLETAKGRMTYKAALDHIIRRNNGTGWNVTIAGIESGDGNGLYGEGELSVAHSRMRGALVLGLFHIPSYEARYYRYEPDVPGRGMTRPVWGDGAAVIALVRARFLAVRYRYLTSDQTGAGHELTIQSDLVF